jgi:hypothetical protein
MEQTIRNYYGLGFAEHMRPEAQGRMRRTSPVRIALSTTDRIDDAAVDHVADRNILDVGPPCDHPKSKIQTVARWRSTQLFIRKARRVRRHGHSVCRWREVGSGKGRDKVALTRGGRLDGRHCCVYSAPIGSSLVLISGLSYKTTFSNEL